MLFRSNQLLSHPFGPNFVKLIDYPHHLSSLFATDPKGIIHTEQNLSIIEPHLGSENLKAGKDLGYDRDNFSICGNRKGIARNDVDIELPEFSIPSFLGALPSP